MISELFWIPNYPKEGKLPQVKKHCPKILSYKVPFGILNLADAWVNRICWVKIQLMASFNWAWDQEGVLGDLTRVLLFLADKSLWKKPETNKRQNRATKKKQ